MKKINVTLTSGGVVLKPLVTAFKGSAGEYVVLDNEVNGSMGLPIILVSKLENNRLVKITDKNEWSTVKEILRNIIAGNQMDYIDVADNIGGDDVFFSQLTLPAASFETLKNNYKPLVGTPAPEPTPVAPVAPVAPVTPVAPAPVSPVGPMGPVSPAPVTPITPVPEPTPMPSVTPVMPEPTPVSNNQSFQSTPEPFVTPFAPTMDNNEPIPNPVIPQAPANNVNEVSAAPKKEIDYSTEKEAFLKACENMFDALVTKLNK